MTRLLAMTDANELRRCLCPNHTGGCFSWAWWWRLYCEDCEDCEGLKGERE